MNTQQQQQHSPPVLEALALNYLTFGFQTLANNLWTWITLITTAAITFWGTDTAAAASTQDLPPTTVPDDQYCRLASSTSTSAPPTSIFSADDDTIGRTSGKFAVYFAVVEDEEEEMDFEEQRDCWADSSFGKQSIEEDRLGMRMRMDFSLYSFQDLTVINGNVVKVWGD